MRGEGGRHASLPLLAVSRLRDGRSTAYHLRKQSARMLAGPRTILSRFTVWPAESRKSIGAGAIDPLRNGSTVGSQAQPRDGSDRDRRADRRTA